MEFSGQRCSGKRHNRDFHLNRVQEEIFLSKAWFLCNMPLLGIELAGKWEDFPLAIRGNLDLERKKSDLAGQTLEAVSIVDLLDAIAHRGYNLYWGDIKAGRAKLNFRLWDSQLATAFDLFGAKAQFMVGGEIIAGRWQPPGWQVPVQRLDGRFSWDTSSKELVLSDVRAKLSHILAQGEGSIIFGVSPLFDVKVRAQEIAEVFDIYPTGPGALRHWPRQCPSGLRHHSALRITGTLIQGGTVYYPGLGAPIKGIRGKVAMILTNNCRAAAGHLAWRQLHIGRRLPHKPVVCAQALPQSQSILQIPGSV